MSNEDLRFQLASEEELVKVLAGAGGAANSRVGFASGLRIAEKMTGVVTLERPDGSPVKPILLVSRDEDQRRLFVRFAQLRSDFSPITSWCYLISPELADRLDSVTIYPDLQKMTAAWCGLVVAEAALMANRSVSKLHSSACFGTQSYAIARAAGLWGMVHHGELIERYDVARLLFGSRPDRVQKMRDHLSPIWVVLLSSTAGVLPIQDRVLRSISEIIARLSEPSPSRSAAEVVASGLLDFVPEAVDLRSVDKMPSKDRLLLYDTLVGHLRNSDRSEDRAFFIAATFACGFLVTVMAGGEASLTVAEASASEFPEILAWAHVLGGLGERVTWTSSFEGLGRLVARELDRPLHLTDGPTADIAIEEARALYDPELPDPLVHFRLKAARTATVSLYPGVTVSVGVDATQDNRPSPAAQGDPPKERQRIRPESPEAVLSLLADALAPLLRDRLKQTPNEARSVNRGRSGSKDKAASRASDQSLPFSDPTKR